MMEHKEFLEMQKKKLIAEFEKDKEAALIFMKQKQIVDSKLESIGNKGAKTQAHISAINEMLEQ